MSRHANCCLTHVNPIALISFMSRSAISGRYHMNACTEYSGDLRVNGFFGGSGGGVAVGSKSSGVAVGFGARVRVFFGCAFFVGVAGAFCCALCVTFDVGCSGLATLVEVTSAAFVTPGMGTSVPSALAGVPCAIRV